jgi:hypothetical protein
LFIKRMLTTTEYIYNKFGCNAAHRSVELCIELCRPNFLSRLMSNSRSSLYSLFMTRGLRTLHFFISLSAL